MTRKIKAVFDRVEGKWAVLACDEAEYGEVLLPAVMVEGFAREGDVLVLTIEQDEDDTAARRQRISALLHKVNQDEKDHEEKE